MYELCLTIKKKQLFKSIIFMHVLIDNKLAKPSELFCWPTQNMEWGSNKNILLAKWNNVLLKQN